VAAPESFPIHLIPQLTETVLAKYGPKALQYDATFDRHLRKLRTALQRQMAEMTLAVVRHFPPGTRISAPRGGLTIWVQLGKEVDSLELFRQALQAGIAVLPGVICANTDAYRNCIRLSCGLPFDDVLDRGAQRLGKIIVSSKPNDLAGGGIEGAGRGKKVARSHWLMKRDDELILITPLISQWALNRFSGHANRSLVRLLKKLLLSAANPFKFRINSGYLLFHFSFFIGG
jgi:hypothetical protein